MMNPSGATPDEQIVYPSPFSISYSKAGSPLDCPLYCFRTSKSTPPAILRAGYVLKVQYGFLSSPARPDCL